MLSEVEMVCDEVAILNKGTLVTQGSVYDLTTSKQRYKSDVSITDSDLVDQIKQKVQSATSQNGSLELEVSGTEQLNEIIDLLRQNSLLIRGIAPFKQTLEESFFQAIQSAEMSDLNEVFQNGKNN